MLEPLNREVPVGWDGPKALQDLHNSWSIIIHEAKLL